MKSSPLAMFSHTLSCAFLFAGERVHTSANGEQHHSQRADDQRLFRAQRGSTPSGRCSLVREQGAQDVPLVDKAKLSKGDGPAGCFVVRSPRSVT